MVSQERNKACKLKKILREGNKKHKHKHVWGIVPGLGGLDGPIRANRFADSRESLDSRESFQGSRTEPLFLRITHRGGKDCESQVWGDSRESLARYENIFFCESICESPRHLSWVGVKNLFMCFGGVIPLFKRLNVRNLSCGMVGLNKSKS